MKKTLIPPAARKIPVETIKHGDLRIDNYAWLRDKSNPEVIEYLKKENEYSESVMETTKLLQQKLYDEFLSRIKEDDESAPYKRGDWSYYNKKEKGKNYLKYYRKRENDPSGSELILDVNKIAEGLKYCSVELLPSPDNRILAYMVDDTGDFCFTTFFKNLQTGELQSSHLKNAWVCAWSNDSNLVYYVKYEHENRGKQVYKHKLGERQDDDKLIFQEKDDKFWVHVITSNSKKYIFIATGSFTTSEVYYLDADDPDGELKLFQQRKEGVLYSVEHNRNEFYILTNLDAPDYRIMKTSVDRTEKDNWKEFVPSQDGVKIEEFLMFRDFLVLAEMDFGLRKVKVINIKTGLSHYIAFPEPVYSVRLQDNFEFKTKYLRYYYISFVTPVSFYDHDMEEQDNILLKEEQISGGYHKDDYVSERIIAKTADGKNVPISIVYKKGMKKDGTNPLDLYAYGSYGISTQVYFSRVRLSILDRDFISAVVHVRGGSELGKSWYNKGKLLNKKNTFDDFITCAEYLISEGYTYRGGIAAEGISAGGTLMGAVANMRPDLFRCIIADVPAMDILNFLTDPDVDTSRSHIEELGDPDNEQHYFYMKSYSPYENIKEQQYPDMLVTTGLNDANVRFWGPAKYTAKLRELKKGNSTLILKTDLSSAHFGPSGRYNQFKEAAYQTAFILKSFGIDE